MSHPNIPLTPVESSQIAGIGYAAESRTLAIRFKGKGDSPGSLYHYDDVSPEDWAAFRDAESIGSHFYRHIKPYPGKFRYARIAEDA
jgi:hypothetical protein